MEAPPKSNGERDILGEPGVAAMAADAGVPVMMLFMHRGGHSGHHFHGAEHTEFRDDLHTTKQQAPSRSIGLRIGQ